MGRVVLTGDLPEGATLRVDGQAVDVALAAGAELVLPAGGHKISVSAPGFADLEQDIYLDPRTLVELPVKLVRNPVERSAQPSGPVAAKPAIPQDLLDQLGQVMAQGQELWVMGRYHTAAQAFMEVERKARDAAQTYRDAATLTALADQAASQFEKLKQACLHEGQPSCPK